MFLYAKPIGRRVGFLNFFFFCTTRSFSTVLDFLLISFATLMKTTSWEGLGRGRERTEDGKGGEKRVGSSCSEVDRGTGERGADGKKKSMVAKDKRTGEQPFQKCVCSRGGSTKKPREAM